MNFRHDFAEMAREEFRNLGMSVPKEWDDYEICIKLFQVLQRHINSNIPYYVLYSKELLQKLPYLPRAEVLCPAKCVRPAGALHAGPFGIGSLRHCRHGGRKRRDAREVSGHRGPLVKLY